MNVGDLVKLHAQYSHDMLGIIVETDVNMWGEETVPSGIRVLWSTNEEEVLYEDELFLFIIE